MKKQGKKAVGLILSLALCLSASLSGCEPVLQASYTLDEDKMLVVYTPHTEEIYGPIIKEFQERTGIWVEVEYAPTSEMLDRIRQEAGAPRCDVVFGGGVESLEANKAYFEAYRTAEYDFIPQTFRAPDDTWTPFSALPLVIIYNTRLVSQREAPARWEDLADPKWRGRLAFASPMTSGSCYTTLATALQIYGDEGWDFVGRFVENLGGEMVAGSADIITGVVDGTYSVGIALEESAKRRMDAGAELAMVYPAEGTSAVPDGTAIVKDCSHPENARLFVDFTVSKDVQNYLAAQLSRRPVRSDVSPPKSLTALSELRIIPYDTSWASQNKGEVLAQWQLLLDEIDR